MSTEIAIKGNDFDNIMNNNPAKESGNPDLFCTYWIDIIQEGQTDEGDEREKKINEEELELQKITKRNAAIIKNSIDPRNIYNTKKLLRNDEVYELYKKTKKIYCPTLTHDFLEIYYAEWKELGHDVSVLFYRIVEKWKLCKAEIDEPEDKSLLTAIHRELTFKHNIVDDWDDSNALELEGQLKMLEEKQFYNLRELTTPELRTKPFCYQINNINKMIDSEENPKMELVTDDNLFFYEDGERVYNYYRDEDTTYDAIEKTRMKGIIVMDNVGIGKSLQALSLISEQNYKRKCSGKDQYKTIMLVPDHLKDHWVSESHKHFTEFNEELTSIITFSEFSKMSIKEGDYDRIIVDEIHELYSKDENSGVYDKIEEMKFNFKHGLTGTPFCISDAPYSLIRFLSDVDLDLVNMCRFKYIQCMFPRIFTRNTLENISSEIELPPMTEINKILKFTRQEKVLYETELQSKNDTDELFLRKLCCDVMINFKKGTIQILTLDDFNKTVIADYYNKFKFEDDECNVLTKIIEAIEFKVKQLKDENNDAFLSKIHTFEEQHVLYSKKLQRQCQKRDNKKASYDFLSSQINSAKECPVCMDEIPDSDEYNMLPCGHIYCPDCYDYVIGTKMRCDVCLKKIDKGQITKISKFSEKTMNYGTKINELIVLGRKLMEQKSNGEIDNNKMIVYSQFPDMLAEMIEILNKEGIKTILFEDTRDVNKFISDDNINCLVISSNKNASGIDMSKVNVIVIYEPIKGDKLYLRDVEKQIIGRVYRMGQLNPVTVYRYIIDDTIEKKIFDDVYKNIPAPEEKAVAASSAMEMEDA